MNEVTERMEKSVERLAAAIDSFCSAFAEWEEIANKIRHNRQCIRVLRRKQYTLGLTYSERQRLRKLMQ